MPFAPYQAPDYMRTGAVASGALSCTVTLPDHRAGDVFVVAVNTFLASEATCDDPTWEELDAIDCDASTSATADHRLAIWAKRATAAEMAANGGVMPNPTFTRGAAGDYIAAFPVTIRGVSEAGTVADALEDIASDIRTSASTTVTWPALTTTVDLCFAMFFVGGGEDVSAINLTAGPTNANLIQGAIRFESGTTEGGGCAFGLETAQIENAGAIGTTTGTIFTGAAQSRIALAFKPPQEADVAPATDTTAPTITDVSPANLSTIDRFDPITFRVGDDEEIAAVYIWIKYASDRYRTLVCSGTEIQYPFAANSTLEQTSITQWDFSILPTGGWRDEIEELEIIAYDASGNRSL